MDTRAAQAARGSSGEGLTNVAGGDSCPLPRREVQP